MTNAMATNRAALDPSAHYVCSTYLVMLQRYLGQLRSEQPAPTTCSPTKALATVIDINAIIPVMNAISAKLNHDCYGLTIGRSMHPSDYGIFGYALMNCPTLAAALKTTAKYKAILDHRLHPEFIFEQGRYIYRLNPHIQNKEVQVLIELDFSAALEFARQLTGPLHRESIQLNSVKFAHAPLGPVHLYEARFNCPVHFNAPSNEIAMSKSLLDMPVYGANQRVLSVLEERIQKIASTERYEKLALKEQVASYVRNNMLWELPNANRVAADFNMSLSSFKKHLSNEQTCYQQICDEVRLSRGVELLKSKTIAIKQISYELGFANTSAFNKAFKRWTGQNPSQYKNGQYTQ